MPMVLYTTEEFIRDLVNAISSSEGKPVDIGGHEHKNIDRSYVFQLISDVKKAVDGQPVSRRRAATSAKTPAVKRQVIPAQARKAIAAAKAAQR